MDNILQIFLSWQFWLFGVGISAIMFVLRTIAEFLMKYWSFAAKESKIWNELLLPILPVILGCVLGAVIKNYPYPNDLGNNVGSRIFMGLVTGLLSGLMYKVIKGLLKQKLPPEIAAKLPDSMDPSAESDDKLVSQVRDSINKE